MLLVWHQLSQYGVDTVFEVDSYGFSIGENMSIKVAYQIDQDANDLLDVDAGE